MKRKDSSGRILKEGESQIKNGTYSYRFTDSNGKRHAVYAKTLQELRIKEEEVRKKILLGVSISSNTTLGEQVKYCIDLRTGLKESTRLLYYSWFNSMESDPVMNIKITDIKPSQLKQWISRMGAAGKSYSTITSYFTGLVRPALDQAVEDGIITRNPALFDLSGLVRKGVTQGRSLTDEEVECLTEYLNQDISIAKNNKCMMLIILETGLRASELCALTVDDIDLDKGLIRVDKQLKVLKGRRWIDTVKSESGVRYIPINDQCRLYLNEAMKDVSYTTLDGYTGFIFHKRDGSVLDRWTLLSRYNHICKNVSEVYGIDICDTSVHSLRHTFCTRLHLAGVDLKTIQYLMGHKNVSTSLNVYTHVSQSHILEEFLKISNAKTHANENLSNGS